MSTAENEYDRPMPRIDLYGGTNVDLRTVAPMYGVGADEPDYLDYDIKGRSIPEKMFFYSGTSYLSGIMSGGFYGARQGLKATPSPRFWLRVNSLMNGAGKSGSRWGNTAGSCGLIYSLFESALDHYEVDRFTRDFRITTPVLAGGLTGALYNIAAPKTAMLAFFVGSGLSGAFHEFRNWWYSRGR